MMIDAKRVPQLPRCKKILVLRLEKLNGSTIIHILRIHPLNYGLSFSVATQQNIPTQNVHPEKCTQKYNSTKINDSQSLHDVLNSIQRPDFFGSSLASTHRPPSRGARVGDQRCEHCSSLPPQILPPSLSRPPRSWR